MRDETSQMAKPVRAGEWCRFSDAVACVCGGADTPPERCASCDRLELITDPDMLRAALKRTLSRVAAVQERATDATSGIQDDIAVMCTMLERLCKGDPAARVDIVCHAPEMRHLAASLNQLAESMQEMITESHEMAIGLCEHYDTLNRLSAGYFEVRSPEDSSNELIAKLGVLINREADSLLDTIAELRRTDEELKSAYQQMQDIVEFLPDATFVIDRNKRIIAWNRAMVEMTGFSRERMLGKGDFEYAIPFYGERQPILIDYLDSDQTDMPQRYSYFEKRADTCFAETYIPGFNSGKGGHIWITATPLFDKSGTRVGAIESVRDVSAFKQAEADKTHLELQLRQVQKMEAIGQLAGGIAHDFNNILVAIIGYGHMLLQKSNDTHTQRYATHILTAAEKAAKLTRDLLAFSRKQVIIPEQIDINVIIERVSDMLTRLIGEDIELRITTCSDKLIAFVDDTQIQQVIMNMVTNARDAMPHGGQIALSTQLCGLSEELARRHRVAFGQYAVIRVTDTGQGMGQETLEKIFEPFYTTKETGRGTGLGLSIVYGIIQQHNGFVDVNSVEGKGTTFEIYLPVTEQHTAAAAVVPAAAIPFARGGSETILLAEDNEDTLQVVKEVLEEAGYRVLCAGDGQEAVRLFRLYASHIDMVLLDVLMPKMNGREVLDAVRALRPDVKYLFASGYTADVIHGKGGLETGVNFLAKPALPNELLSKVREILDAP